MNDNMRDMIMRNCSADELREAARGYGMVSLRDQGLAYVYDGTTTAEEVIRETAVD
jgi:type II secretory ATPase GspE/PulE/Tfp pilus assembly ATPase PilB-like protein